MRNKVEHFSDVISKNSKNMFRKSNSHLKRMFRCSKIDKLIYLAINSKQ